MPGRDGTGPNGEGPNTGRGIGGCLNNNMPGRGLEKKGLGRKNGNRGNRRNNLNRGRGRGNS